MIPIMQRPSAIQNSRLRTVGYYTQGTRHMRHQDPQPPFTHHVDVKQAMETLDHGEMVALAEMFGNWAINEEGLDDDQRTKVLMWSADYERVAAFAGKAWRASMPGNAVSLVQFVARNAF